MTTHDFTARVAATPAPPAGATKVFGLPRYFARRYAESHGLEFVDSADHADMLVLESTGFGATLKQFLSVAPPKPIRAYLWDANRIPHDGEKITPREGDAAAVLIGGENAAE